MGTLLTGLIAALVIGYAAYTMRKAFKEVKAGGCSGCSSCSTAQKCHDKK